MQWLTTSSANDGFGGLHRSTFYKVNDRIGPRFSAALYCDCKRSFILKISKGLHPAIPQPPNQQR